MTLRTAIATPEGKRRYVRRLFATIADRYDLITRVLSYGQDRRWKRRLIGLARLHPSDRVLDLACGTGDLLFEAAPTVRLAVGVDVTLRMLQLAARRREVRPKPDAPGVALAAGAAHPEARAPVASSVGRMKTRAPALVAGDMTSLPIGGARFDVVTTGYGLRNVPDLEGALAEIHRVLAPGGRLLSLDFNRPANPVVRAAYHAYLTATGSALGLVLHGDPDTYRYIPESIRRYPGAAGVARLMREAGFTEVVVFPVLGGLLSIHTCRKPGSVPGLGPPP